MFVRNRLPLLLAGLFPFTAFGASFNSSYTLLKDSYASALYGQYNSEEVSDDDLIDHNLNIVSQVDLNSKTKLSVGLNFLQKDYGGLELRDQKNKSYLVLDEEKTLDASAAFAYKKQQHEVNFAISRTLHQAKFAQQAASLEYAYGIYNDSSKIKSLFNFSNYKRPSDYFLNDSFALIERPKSVSSFAAQFSFEQIINSSFKSIANLHLVASNKERPFYYGIEFIQKFALSDRVFSSLSLAYFKDKNQLLAFSDRGLFRSKALRVDMAYELNYDFWIYAAYTLASQSEKTNRATVQLGSDTYQVGISFEEGKLDLDISAFLTSTNTKAFRQGMVASLVWEI